MSKTKITAPNKGFNGVGAGGLKFEDGVAHTDDESLLNYFTSAGYGVGGDVPDVEEPEVLDPRTIGDGSGIEVVGTRLRDAAVDPHDDDFLPPTNAGEENPHGPLVVAPGIHAVETQVIRPGVVHVDDLDKQEAAETAQAVALLVENQDVGDVMPTFDYDKSDTGPLGLSDPGSVEVGKAEAKGIAKDDPVEVKKARAQRAAKTSSPRRNRTRK